MHDVLIFDSGLGGLSIASELRNQLPQLSMLYVSDYAGFPYGLKSEPWLVERVETVLRKVLEQWQVKVLIIACNTASTVTLPSLRQRLPLPIVGVVPAIKPAAQFSTRKQIALLATPATIGRAYTAELIRDFAADCEVIRISSSRLVEIAEEKLRNKLPDQAELKVILSPILRQDENNSIDTVVLACTHFPLLKPELTSCLAGHVKWVDSGEAIARRVRSLLSDSSQNSPENIALLTEMNGELAEIKQAFASFGFSRLELIT